MLKLLKKSVSGSSIVNLGGYQYFINPVTDGIPRMKPELLREIIDHITSTSKIDCDVIIGPESMGIPLAVALSLSTGIPYTVVRKRLYNIPGEVRITQKTGYSEKDMSINGVKRGDRVFVIDDVISKGGSMRSLLNALIGEIGAVVTEVVVVFEKDRAVMDSLRSEFDVPIRSLLHAEIVDGRVVID